MICPSCNSEYVAGYTHCKECDVDLIEPVLPVIEPEIALVKVYETGNAAIIPLVESLFQDADIVYMKKGDAIQDLIGWGRFGTNLNYALGPVAFFVRDDDAEEARAIVEALDRPAEHDEDPR